MIIRSQDKKFVYNFNNFEAIYVSDYGRDGYCARIGVNQDSAVVGKYSTEEKAIKVLDMIEVAYRKNTFIDGVVFQMPQDSEV